LADDVAFWMSTGYDSITLNAWMFMPGEGPAFAMEFGAAGRRQFSPAVPGLIQTWEDYEKYDWDCEKVDLSHFETIRSLLPPKVKAIAYGGKVFMTSWMMMGFEHFCETIYDDEELVGEVIRRYGDIWVREVERLIEIDTVGAIWTGDDLAYQTATLVSPVFLRKHIFPYYKKVSELAHSRNVPTIFHSDGNLNSILPDLIDCGIDCIHPIETDAMDIVTVKEKYGSKLCIAGNIDLMTTLSYGSPADVEAEVKQRLRQLAPGGGYVLSSSNGIADFVPPQNLIAMLKTLHREGHYPITC
jgi:uroporphyrinogen decarboxylase